MDGERRYQELTVLSALEFSDVFRGCCRISAKKVLSGMSRDTVAKMAGTLTRLYCNQNAENVVFLLSGTDKRREKLLQRVKHVEEQKAKRGVGLVVSFDITPLEILRKAISMNPKTMNDVPKEDIDRIQFEMVKIVMQVNEDLMRYKIGGKDEHEMAKLFMINSASYNDVLKESKDAYVYQVAQSFLLFKWMEGIPKYQELLCLFYNRYGIQSWKDYVRTVYGLALLSFQKDAGILPMSIKTDPPGLLSSSVIEKLSIDVNKETIPYSSKDEYDRAGNSDYRHFKSRPLLKLSNGDYVVHNPKILIDRLYSSLYFDFSDIADEIEGRHPDVPGLFTESFVEKTMFSGYLKECLSSGYYDAYEETQLKQIYKIHDGEPGYPDFYLRRKDTNAAILFECKDIRLNSWVKEQRDYSLLEKEIKNKIVEKTYKLDWENHCHKEVTPKRIGVGQLAAHAANISKAMFPWDKTLPADCLIYPVLVIADNRLIFDGLPHLAQQWYEERLQMEGVRANISKPLIMMSPLTLLKYSDLFREKGFEFFFEKYYKSLIEEGIGGYVDIINRMISFDSYMEQYPYSLDSFRKEIMDELFNKKEIEELDSANVG